MEEVFSNGELSRPKKIQKLDLTSNSSYSDDDEVSSITTNGNSLVASGNSGFYDINRKYSEDSIETAPYKRDGLSLLLDALLQSESSMQSSDSGESNDELDMWNGANQRPTSHDSSSDLKQSCSPFLSDSDRWSTMFSALEEYGQIHGHCNPPISYECTVRGTTFRLGTWLSTQRQLKRKNNLRPDREAQLQTLVDKSLLQWSIPSIASPDDDKWNSMYSSLLKYGQAHGHCNVPYSHNCILDDGTWVKLGAWLRKQREQKKKGTLRTDRDERLAILVNAKLLRMPSQQATEDDQWSTMMDALEGYGAKHGHCNVSQCHKYKLEDGSIVWLGAWLQKQRELKKKGSLKADRLVMLQALVDENMLQWDSPCHTPSDDEKWDIMLDALSRYSRIYGHCNLSAGESFTIDDGTVVKLGAWLSQQRHHKKKGKLRPDRESKLQVLVDEGKLYWGMRGKNDSPSNNSTSSRETSFENNRIKDSWIHR